MVHPSNGLRQVQGRSAKRIFSITEERSDVGRSRLTLRRREPPSTERAGNPESVFHIAVAPRGEVEGGRQRGGAANRG
jgi:hypothetical protein